MLQKLFLSILLSITIISCEDDKTIIEPKSINKQYSEFKGEILNDDSGIKISLERTACFGSCPIYTIAIFKSGRVEYFGYEFMTQKLTRLQMLFNG